MDSENGMLRDGVFIDGEFGVCHMCSRPLLVLKHLVHAHAAEEGLVHFVWQHPQCSGDVYEIELSMEDYKACKSWLARRKDKASGRVWSDSELNVLRFRTELEAVQSIEDLGWMVNGHE